jgi:hypothetical protein
MRGSNRVVRLVGGVLDILFCIVGGKAAKGVDQSASRGERMERVLWLRTWV